jgi:thioredoxin reductase (NADPH)
LVELTLSEQGSVQARAVVVACGARYKRPPVANLKQFESYSVHYWASPIEAKLCAGEEIALVGAGNSAGQAVVFLAPQVKRLTLIVRGNGLEASMSRYLIDRIKLLENVRVLVRTELVDVQGDQEGALEGVTVVDRDSGLTSRLPARHVFVFIGAEPNTAWLDGCLALDEKGYIITGLQSSTATRLPSYLPLQTSLPRIFAIGDVRSGSTKRVASAVGEGAAVVAQIHSLLGASVTAA